MQKKLFLFAIFLGLLALSCAEEGFVKVYKCPDAKPFFNTVDSRCYSSQASAEEVNKVIAKDKEEVDDMSEEDSNLEPSDPTKPDEPGVPANPDEPGVPANPDKPGVPANPDEPGDDEPVSPGEPLPEDPNQPIEA